MNDKATYWLELADYDIETAQISRDRRIVYTDNRNTKKCYTKIKSAKYRSALPRI